MNLQEAYAKALLVDRAALERAQADGDVLGANRILVDAYAPTFDRCARRCDATSARRPTRSPPSAPAATRAR